MVEYQKIKEALDALKQFNTPKKQINDRSALTLLSLVCIKENDSWKDATKIYTRVHDIMQFCKKNYNKEYAENSRETFRRQTLHQFESEVGLAKRNADNPTRPTNSPHTTWSISDATLEVLKFYGTDEWDSKLKIFFENVDQNIDIYHKTREKHSLKVSVNGKELIFSPGIHNELQISIIKDFRHHFCPNAEIVYVGDTAHKMLYINKKLAKEVGMTITKHDILPDVVMVDRKINKLYLVEAVACHGPVSNKRLVDLNEYLKSLDLKKSFISAFPDFKEFKRHVDDIAWETEVWLSEIPHHMIHFNGDKYLRED